MFICMLTDNEGVFEKEVQDQDPLAPDDPPAPCISSSATQSLENAAAVPGRDDFDDDAADKGEDEMEVVEVSSDSGDDDVVVVNEKLTEQQPHQHELHTHEHQIQQQHEEEEEEEAEEVPNEERLG
jgi:hypothetical protein